MVRPRFHLLAAVAVLLAAVSPLAALSRVTLRNGFSYDCAREELLDSTHTRLYLSATEGTGFLDIPTSSILTTDTLPDPPASTTAAAASPALPAIPTLLHAAGTLHHIDAELLASIVHAESNGNPAAVSRAGAQGLMQLMPSTAHALGVTDLLLPEANIDGGTAYLDALLTRYHDNLALALAAYNAGPAAVDRFHGIPPFRETQRYVVRVMTEFKRRKALLATAAHP